VVLNTARAQGDYFQATRGGGHGDYRHIVLAPCDVKEATVLVQEAFHLAATWRNPVLVMGDYYLAHTWQTVDVAPIDFGPRPPTDWAVDGSTGGSGRAKLISPLGDTKRTDDVGYDELGRLMVGGQTMLEVAFGAAAVAVVLGVLWGATAGYFGGLLDGLMMRIVDALRRV